MCTQITLLIITFTFKTLTFNFEFWWCGHVIIYYVNNIWFCAKHLNRKIVIIYVTMCSLEFLIWMLCSDQCQAWWSWIPMDIFEVWKSQEDRWSTPTNRNISTQPTRFHRGNTSHGCSWPGPSHELGMGLNLSKKNSRNKEKLWNKVHLTIGNKKKLWNKVLPTKTLFNIK